MKKLKGRFVATDDKGQDYAIEIYVDIIDASTHDDPNSTVEGLKSLQTDDGLHVNRISKGEYLIVQTGLRLHSDSPDAP
ncbi:MAG: hypothetical protein AB1453_12665 [Chloroflexota bacterium]